MNLESCYAECLVKRKNTVGGNVAKYCIIFIMVLSGLITLLLVLMLLLAISMISFVVFAITFFLFIYMTPRFNVDWEYVFCDGQLDFDQILGGNARRRKLRIDFDNLEILAPENSDKLADYRNMQFKEQDFTSLMSDRRVYVIICRSGADMLRIKFEPDDNMLGLMKNKSPRKVIVS